MNIFYVILGVIGIGTLIIAAAIAVVCYIGGTLNKAGHQCLDYE